MEVVGAWEIVQSLSDKEWAVDAAAGDPVQIPHTVLVISVH